MQMCLLHSPLNTDLWASVDCSFCQRNECLHFLGPPDNDNDGCANALRLYLPPYTSKEELQVRRSTTSCFFRTWDEDSKHVTLKMAEVNATIYMEIIVFFWCFRAVLMLPTRCLDADTTISNKRLRRRQCIQMQYIDLLNKGSKSALRYLRIYISPSYFT